MPVEPPQEAADLAYALNGLAEALATSEGRQREFLLSVSHELRTPLTTIRGYAEALADGVVPAEGAPRAGRTVLAEAERLDRLVTDLLALARLDAVDFTARPDPDRPGPAGRRGRARRGGPRCDAAGIVLRVEVAAGADRGVRRSGPHPAGDRRADGERAAGRAVRRAGGARRRRAAAPAPPVRWRCATAGRASPTTTCAVAFERGALHQRYQGVRKAGSGLGLALAAGLVRRLGGRIEAGHAPEGGARFTVWLPDRRA